MRPWHWIYRHCYLMQYWVAQVSICDSAVHRCTKRILYLDPWCKSTVSNSGCVCLL